MTACIFDILIRVSAMGDRRESADSTMTLGDQEDRCRRRIEIEGGRVGLIHDARDVSGWISVDSPAFRDALGRVRSGDTSGFAVAYGDRLARNVRKLGRFFDECEDVGADVLFADRPELDYRSEDGRMSTTLDGLMAERKYLSDKKRGDQIADRVIFERGVANVVAYGYRRNGTFVDGKLTSKIDDERDAKALVPDPETAPVVRRIFALRLDGHSWTKIADELNESGVASPRGGRWTTPTLRGIVQNEAYTGLVRYGAKRRNESAHEPLVPRATWAACQSVQTVQHSGTYSAGIAGGLLFCGCCGGRLAVAGSGRYLTYGCRRQRNGGRCSAPVFVTKSRADAFVEAEVLDALAGIEPARGDNDQISRLTAERDAAREMLDTALERSMMLRDPGKAQSLIQRAEAALDGAENLLGAAVSQAETVGGLLPTAEHWQGLSGDQRRRVAGVLIERVVVGPKAVKGGCIEDRFAITAR